MAQMSQEPPELHILSYLNVKDKTVADEQIKQLKELIDQGFSINSFYDYVPNTYAWQQHNFVTSAIINDREDVLELILPALSADDINGIKLGPNPEDHMPLIFCALQAGNIDRLRQVIDFLDEQKIDWRNTQALRWCEPKSNEPVNIFSYWDYAQKSDHRTAELTKTTLLAKGCTPTENDLVFAVAHNQTTFLERAIEKDPKQVLENSTVLSKALTVDHTGPFNLLLKSNAQFDRVNKTVKQNSFDNLAHWAKNHGGKHAEKRVQQYQEKKAALETTEKAQNQPPIQPRDTSKWWYWDKLPLPAKIVLGALAVVSVVGIPITLLAIRYQRKIAWRNAFLNQSIPIASGVSSQSFAATHAEVKKDFDKKSTGLQPSLQAQTEQKSETARLVTADGP